MFCAVTERARQPRATSDFADNNIVSEIEPGRIGDRELGLLPIDCGIGDEEQTYLGGPSQYIYPSPRRRLVLPLRLGTPVRFNSYNTDDRKSIAYFEPGGTCVHGLR